MAQENTSNGQSMCELLSAAFEIPIRPNHKTNIIRGNRAEKRHFFGHCRIAAIGKTALARVARSTMMAIDRSQIKLPSVGTAWLASACTLVSIVNVGTTNNR